MSAKKKGNKNRTLRQPTMVVVRAELCCVQSTVEYIRMKPMTQEREKAARKPADCQPSNSTRHARQSSSRREITSRGMTMKRAL